MLSVLRGRVYYYGYAKEAGLNEVLVKVKGREPVWVCLEATRVSHQEMARCQGRNTHRECGWYELHPSGSHVNDG
jgi:hypothetical protein